MKKKALVLIVSILLVGVNLYAAGDLVVQGKVGVGTENLNAKINVVSDDSIGLQVNVKQNLATPGYIFGGSFRAERRLQVYDPWGITGFTNSLTIKSEAGVGSPSDAFTNGIIFAVPANKTATFGQYADISLGRMQYVRAWSHAGIINANNLTGLLFDFPYNDGGSGQINAENFVAISVRNMLSPIITARKATGLYIAKVNGSEKSTGIILDGNGAGADIAFGNVNQRAKIYSNNGELFAEDSASNVTQISPHDPETGEWIFYSKNTKTGVVKRVNMEELVRDMEKLTGKKYLVETTEGSFHRDDKEITQ